MQQQQQQASNKRTEEDGIIIQSSSLDIQIPLKVLDINRTHMFLICKEVYE